MMMDRNELVSSLDLIRHMYNSHMILKVIHTGAGVGLRPSTVYIPHSTHLHVYNVTVFDCIKTLLTMYAKLQLLVQTKGVPLQGGHFDHG